MPTPMPQYKLRAERRKQIEGTIEPNGALTLAGRTLSAREWHDELGVSAALIAARLAYGETVRTALTAPVGTVHTPEQQELSDQCDAFERTLGGAQR